MATLLWPGAAFACALPPSVILTLPTGYYITGAAVTVGVTAVLGVFARSLPAMQAVPVLTRGVWVPVAVSSYLSCLCFLGLVLVGLFGPPDPMHNLMTLVFWTGVWIALPLASADHFADGRLYHFRAIAVVNSTDRLSRRPPT
jgi:hypothetical protein